MSSSQSRTPEWGSDLIADLLTKVGIKWVALVPSSASRGIHDSIINYAGNTDPKLLPCLHEEASVAIAHGYAKVTGRPMAAIVYSNVGLMHATMAIFDAFCDRVPVLIIGAHGPADSVKRRPWIDWIHTAVDPAALIRPYVKFDDQALSVGGAVDALLDCHRRSITKPCAPTYCCINPSPMEERIEAADYVIPDRLIKYQPSNAQADPSLIRRIQAQIHEAKRPFFLIGRTTTSQKAWQQRVEIVEKSDGIVATDIKQPCAFPTQHRAHVFPPSFFNSQQTLQVLAQADLIISLDWVDLAGTVKSAFPKASTAKPHIIHVSLDHNLHNGWSNDRFGFIPVDTLVQVEPDSFVDSLLTIDGGLQQSSGTWTFDRYYQLFEPSMKPAGDRISTRTLANALQRMIPPSEMCLIRSSIEYNGSDLVGTQPLSYLGMDGGAGVGSGPGMTVGAALALREIGSPILPVAVLGDGDFFMGGTAFWSAARERVPLLVIVANNASYYNDEIHQERVARARDRPVENKAVGISLDDPEPDVGKMAESMGLATIGPQISKASTLDNAISEAVTLVKGGKGVVLDVKITMQTD